MPGRNLSIFSTSNYLVLCGLCCVALSISQDGVLCIHCLTSRELLRKTLLSKYDSVAAAVFVPHPSSSSSSSGGGGQRLLLFAAAGCELLLLTLEVAAAAASGGEQDQQHQHCGTTAAAAAASEAADLDVLCRSQVTSDDISALAVNRQGTYLAAADDAGGQQQQQQHWQQQRCCCKLSAWQQIYLNQPLWD